MDFKEVPLWVIAFLISGSFHEFAHAYAAFKLGDDTAARAGRMTVNPLPHIDPTGLIFLVIMSFSGMGIGWMKPVPVNLYNLRHPRRDNMIVAVAGPVSNIILAAVFDFVVRMFPEVLDHPQGRLLEIFLILNMLLAAFNLLPIFPLDGSHIVEGLLPESMLEGWNSFKRYGFFVLIILLFTRMLWVILMPILHFISFIIGLPGFFSH